MDIGLPWNWTNVYLCYLALQVVFLGLWFVSELAAGAMRAQGLFDDFTGLSRKPGETDAEAIARLKAHYRID